MTTELPPSPSLTTQLQLVSRWTKDRLRFVRWGRASSDLIFSAFIRLRSLLRPLLSCRWLARQLPKFRFVARVDIASYYNSINHAVLKILKLKIHSRQKRFIGKISKGFDFLGYWFQPERKLQPSAECLRRHRTRIRRLYEQGADSRRLRQYVDAWLRWLHAGLRYLVTPTSCQPSNITTTIIPSRF